jgi:hypothetical protein
LAYLKHMTFVLDFIKCWMRLRHRDIQWEYRHKIFTSF